MKKLAIITTHPIQYYAPIFKLLHQRKQIEIKVFYTWGEQAVNKFDPGFNKVIAWDIPVLEGYPYEWVKNVSKDPGSHSFKGIINPGLIKQVESWAPDAILFFGWGYHSHLKALRYFKNKIPVFFRGDSTLLDEKEGIKTIIKSIFLKWVYRHVDCAFYVGTNNKAYFKKYGLKDKQLIFAPHAIDNARFGTDKTEDALQLRKRFGIGNDEVLIFFAGKLEGKKAPLLLLESFTGLNKKNVHLLFAGNGYLEQPLKEAAAGFVNIHFIDFQNQTEMPVAYQACDLFCLPSKGPGETWGLAINEAMACKKAVVASDKVGCAVDLVKNNFNGMTFKSGSADELRACLMKLTVSKSLLTEYGQNSASVIKDWSFDEIAGAMENKLIY